MSIIDSQAQFASGTAWGPTTTGNNFSPNVLDTAPLSGGTGTNTGRNLGEGESMYLLITVTTAATSSGSATVDFRIRTDSNTNMTTTPVDVCGTEAIAYTALTLGAQFKIKLPNATYQEYVAVNAVIATAALTGGTFECELVKDLSSDTIYAAGYSVT